MNRMVLWCYGGYGYALWCYKEDGVMVVGMPGYKRMVVMLDSVCAWLDYKEHVLRW